MPFSTQSIHKEPDSEDWAFVTQAKHITRAIYASQLGPELPVTKRIIRDMNIRHVFWNEDGSGRVIAATMLSETRPNRFRIAGIAVDSAHHRQGHGSALVNRLQEVVPPGATLELGVDKDKDNTEWLVRWYTRMGFEIDAARSSPEEIIMLKSPSDS